MADKISKALAVVSKFIKPPWKLSGGPVADAAYKSHLPRADKYRTICPTDVKDLGLYNPGADDPLKQKYLHNTDRIFNTRYYSRDSRRTMSKVMGHKKVVNDFTKPPEPVETTTGK